MANPLWSMEQKPKNPNTQQPNNTSLRPSKKNIHHTLHVVILTGKFSASRSRSIPPNKHALIRLLFCASCHRVLAVQVSQQSLFIVKIHKCHTMATKEKWDEEAAKVSSLTKFRKKGTAFLLIGGVVIAVVVLICTIFSLLPSVLV